MYLNSLTLITYPLTKGAHQRDEICPLHAFKKEGMKREHEEASQHIQPKQPQQCHVARQLRHQCPIKASYNTADH